MTDQPRVLHVVSWLVIAVAGLLLSGYHGPVVCRAAGPAYWDFPEAYAYSDLELEGAALDSYGRLTRGLSATELLAGEPEVFWRAVNDGDGGLYVGSGHGGEIWHIDRKGNTRPLVTVEGTEVFSLSRVGDQLYVGCGPEGQIYRVGPDGQAVLVDQIIDGYVWAMTSLGDQLYLATGSPAAVYRLDREGRLANVVTLPAFNALDLAATSDGRLLVTTQGPGLIYAVDPDDPGSLQLVFEAAEDEVRQIVQGPAGEWFALALAAEPDHQSQSNGNGLQSAAAVDLLMMTPSAPPAPRSVLYHLRPDGLVVSAWAGDVDLMVVAHSETWGWLGGSVQPTAGGDARLYTLEEPTGVRPVASWPGGDVLDLLVRPSGRGRDEVVACLAHPGQVVLLSDETGKEQAATALSQPLDGGQVVQWGRLQWSGPAQAGSGLEWSVRGGARSVPDETWTDWSKPWRERDHRIDLPPSRFLQWRVRFTNTQPGQQVAAVTVSGYEPNLPPRIEMLELQPPGHLSDGGLMYRADNLTESFRSGLRVEYSLPGQRDRRSDPVRASVVRPLRSVAWQASDPNEDRLVYQLEYQALGGQTWRPIGRESQEFVKTWDTSTVPDGHYLLRVRASDRLDNPASAALDASRQAAPVLVDNTPPRIQGLRVRRSEGGFEVRMQAEDELSALAGARIELPDGTRERLDPVDRICDSSREEFNLKIAFPRPDSGPAPDPWRIRVEVFDRQGNVAAAEDHVQ